MQVNERQSKDFKTAIELLERCNEGFSAFMNGRKMARKERDKLRSEISDFVREAKPVILAKP